MIISDYLSGKLSAQKMNERIIMEGPSIHLLAEELTLFIKQKVTDCYGNAAFNKALSLTKRLKLFMLLVKGL